MSLLLFRSCVVSIVLIFLSHVKHISRNFTIQFHYAHQLIIELPTNLNLINNNHSSIAWAQLTLASGPDHEAALDALYDVFYGSDSQQKKAERHRPWTPHNSFAYDNPEDTILTTANAFEAVAQYPTLLTEERNVAAISLWDTNGKMGDWKCLERITF